jgi:hypothetical protein
LGGGKARLPRLFRHDLRYGVKKKVSALSLGKRRGH